LKNEDHMTNATTLFDLLHDHVDETIYLLVF
jgi:hypothetical protein